MHERLRFPMPFLALSLVAAAILACNLKSSLQAAGEPSIAPTGLTEPTIAENVPSGTKTRTPQETTSHSATNDVAAPVQSLAPERASPEPTPSPISIPNIDILMQTCPTAEEINQFHRDFDLFFDPDLGVDEYRCEAEIDLQGPTNRRWALYQALRAIHVIRFEQPLPWTSLPLYDWLKGAIDGIALSDPECSYCCDGQQRIVLKADLLEHEDMKVWVNPQSGHGMIGLIGLIIHEARHAEVGGHTCGDDDATLAELGAWGTQYYLFLFLADHTPEGFFGTAQRWSALAHAETALSRICQP